MVKESMIVTTSKGLYKYLLRECQKLPKDAQEFYKHSIRQSFKQHTLESDPVRVKQIIERALEDASWVVKKYAGRSPK
jgi:hypothetical protein